MRAVRSVDSLAYGVRLTLSLLAVLLVGGGLLALGALVGYADLRALLSGSPYSQTRLLGGAALAILGAVLAVAGGFGTVHKLVADSVAAGVAAGESTRPPTEAPEQPTAGDDPESDDSAGETERPPDQASADQQDRSLPGAQPGETESSPAPSGSDQPADSRPASEQATATGEQRSTPENGDTDSETRRTFSPGEIAFGAEAEQSDAGGADRDGLDSEDDPETNEFTDPGADEKLGTDSGEWRSATGSGGDPLADLSEEE